MISIKSERELKDIQQASRIAAKTVEGLSRVIRAGISTEKIDELAGKLIQDLGGQPAFKGYRGFPKNICTSVNEELIHGIPSARILKEGDIISLDIGVNFNGYYGDVSVTLPVGKISQEARRLINVAKEALYKAIETARVNKRLSDISWAIQNFVEEQGFSVVKDFVGHGIGSSMHEEPEIPNFGRPGHGPILSPGMVLAIEPMVNEGSFEVEVLSDGWTVVTKDRKLCCHFEHTICIQDNGTVILTDYPPLEILENLH